MPQSKIQPLKINKRKIQASQFIRADEGKLRINTPDGRYWCQDKDWLVPVDKDCFVVIPGGALTYLQGKDD